jgi:SEC-C motif-containing protein
VWLGLKVESHTVTGAETGEVVFTARLRVGGGSAQRMHERSRFVREGGHWFYVDGDVG